MEINEGKNFAVIDTETNWINQVMSIGIVIADERDFSVIQTGYYILTPEYLEGGMFANTLFFTDHRKNKVCDREEALAAIKDCLAHYGVEKIFAYNAGFDYGHLPELADYKWYDIMRLAAYRQYNKSIPKNAECCSTGRLKRGFGVESVLRMFEGNKAYSEKHNAVYDAYDELRIMRYLGYGLETYIQLNK